MTINETLPKSRITLTYRTKVEGQKQDVELPFRLLVLGDFSLGTSKDSKIDFDLRKIRNLDSPAVDGLMADMGLSLDIDVANKIDGTGDIKETLHFDKMSAFEPAAVAEQIPKLKDLALMKRLLIEVQADLDNRKRFRNKIRALKPADNKELQTMLEELFAGSRLPEKLAANPDEDDAADADDSPASDDAATPSDDSE